ncbi:MAG: hypothetical protein LUC48_11360 [Clostridiales bacterium]|nr:hypothetical protein [Clostridiales bacterium]
MDDFEEKLNTILSSPETMGQIMALANSISGKPEGGASAQGDAPQPQGAPQQPPQTGAAKQTGDMLSLLQGLDPATLSKLAALYQEYTRGEDEKAALLGAMRPFLRPERQEKVEKALQITRISRVIQAAFGLFREEHHV